VIWGAVQARAFIVNGADSAPTRPAGRHPLAGRPDRGKKNRAKWSEGDQEARGIFEFSTNVGLGVFRAMLYKTPTEIVTGSQRTIPNIWPVLKFIRPNPLLRDHGLQLMSKTILE
jgi:hypothetical protein